MAPNKETNIEKLDRLIKIRKYYLERKKVVDELSSEFRASSEIYNRAIFFRAISEEYPQTKAIEILPKVFIDNEGISDAFSRQDISRLGQEEIVPYSLMEQIGGRL
jgi:hypothetical protein